MKSADAVVAYEKDLAEITRSGPWTIDAEKQLINRRVWARCVDIMPIDDIHKKNDADLIYRFLIAARWDEDKAGAMLREYVAFRQKHALNHILWETFPEEADIMRCHFFGFDLEGHPMFFQKIDMKAAVRALKKVSAETLVRAHLAHQEEARRLSKIFCTDRVTAVLDLSSVTLTAILNPKNVSFWKDMSHLDQAMFPELMRTMLIINGGWVFNTLWKILRPLLDMRVQKKFQFIDGKKVYTELLGYMDESQVPASCGGTNPLSSSLWKYENYRELPPGTPPKISGAVSATGVVHIIPECDGSQARYTDAAMANLPSAEDLGDLEFKSIPSDDEIGPSPALSELSGTSGNFLSSPICHSGQFPGPSPPPGMPRSASSHNMLCTAVSAPKRPNGAQIMELLIHERPGDAGQHRYEGIWEGEHIATAIGNNIFDAFDHQLKAQLLVEGRHPMHTNLIIANEKMQGFFVLKRRNFHREIHIFQPVNPTIVRKSMEACIEGKRNHAYTCRAPAGGPHDIRDWDMSVHKTKGAVICAKQTGDMLQFREQLLWLPPCYLFALALGIQELWSPL